jgi:outer membrane protein TolC
MKGINMWGKCTVTMMVLIYSTAQVALGQTGLESVIDYALKNNRSIKKSDLQIKEASYAIRETTANGLPRISDSLSYVRAETPKEVYSAGTTLQLTQLLYSQSFWTGLKTAGMVKELYAIAKTKNEDSVIADVATSYYQAGALMLQKNTVEKSIKNLQEILRMTELQYDNGFVKQTNVNRLKVTITNLDVTRQTLQNGIDAQLNYLKAIAGMPLDTVIEIDTNTILNISETKSPSVEFKLENVPVYQAVAKQLEVSRQQVQLSMAQCLPVIVGFGQLKRSGVNVKSDIDKWTNTNAVGVAMAFPLFTSGGNYAKIRQAMLRRDQIETDVLQLKDFLKVQFENSEMDLNTSKKLLDVQKENKLLAETVYRQTSLQYQEGMASLADLLNVNSDYLNADNSYNQQILKCKISEIKMMKASGVLKQMITEKN